MFRYEGEIDEKIILKFISKYEKENKDRYKKLMQYYKAENSILNRSSMSDSNINNKVSNNYAGYIVDMSVGYFIGNPVTYDSTDNDLMSIFQNLYNYNDEQDENMDIAKQCSIKGRCFEIVYLDENDLDENNLPKLRFNKIMPENMFAVYDYNISGEMIFAVRFYEKTDVDDKVTKKIEVYTKDCIIYYTEVSGKLVQDNIIQHYFGIVPVIEYFNNEEAQGDFEKVITLIDSYDKTASDSMNNIEYFANCYLYLIGMSATEENDIEDMRKKRVLLLDEKGEAGFLQKQSNVEETSYLSKRLDEDIHKFALVPNLSDENFANNISGVAMKYKLLGLEQLAVKKERKFKRGLQRRIEIISNYLNFKGSNIDFRDIKITFSRNIPIDNKENVEIVEKLQKIVSKKTALSNLLIIDDVNAEIENLQQEQQDYVDLDRLIMPQDHVDLDRRIM